MSEERVISHSDIEKAINSVKAIKDGPRALQLYMDICAKCGTCAEQCHVSKANPNRRTNPAAQSDLIRKLYKQDGSILTKISGLLNGNNKSLSADEPPNMGARLLRVFWLSPLRTILSFWYR